MWARTFHDLECKSIGVYCNISFGFPQNPMHNEDIYSSTYIKSLFCHTSVLIIFMNHLHLIRKRRAERDLILSYEIISQYCTNIFITIPNFIQRILCGIQHKLYECSSIFGFPISFTNKFVHVLFLWQKSHSVLKTENSIKHQLKYNGFNI